MALPAAAAAPALARERRRRAYTGTVSAPGIRQTLVVDTHNHFWDIERSDLYWLTPDLQVLHRTFTPPDLRPHLEAVGVDRSVIVQAARSRWDNHWWLQLAEQYDYIAGVVGWVDLDSRDVGAVLDDYGRHPAFRGVRATAENEPNPDWLASPAVRRGIGEVARRGLTLDLLVRTEHLPHVPRLAEEQPDLLMVVDHLAKPPIASGELETWAQRMDALAPYPNIWCKVSGLVTEAGPPVAGQAAWQSGPESNVSDLLTAAGPEPTADRIRPVVEFALRTIGVDRLMWGSDWPVCLLASDYETTYRTVLAALGPLSEPDRAALFGGNAMRFYRIA
jgi:L-fuconolactonase